MALRRLEGYPQKSESDKGITYQDKFDCDDGTESLFDRYLIGMSYDVDPRMVLKNKSTYLNKTKWQMDLVWGFAEDAGGNGQMVDSGKPSYSLEDGGQQLPIEQHPNFKTKWTYYLFQSSKQKDFSTSVPSQWATWTNLTTDPTWDDPANGVYYRIGKTPSELPSDVDDVRYWKIADEPEKPKVEYFKIPSEVIIESYRFSNKRKIKNLPKVGDIKDPGYTFEIEDGVWFVDSVRCRQDGRSWLVEVVYQHTNEIDSDIYPVPES